MTQQRNLFGETTAPPQYDNIPLPDPVTVGTVADEKKRTGNQCETMASIYSTHHERIEK